MFNVSFGLIKEFQKRGVRNIEWLAQGFEESFYRFDRLTEEEQKLYSTDVVLVGRITPTRDGRHPGYAERARLIGRLLREGIRVTWWGPRIPRRLRNLRLLFSGVGRAWGGKFIFNQEYAKAATGAKVFLASEAQPEVERTLSSRIFAACGCGAFYLTQYARGIEEVFVPGREIAVFRGADEMVAQVRHYLQHEDERCAIAEAGRRRVLKEYTYQARFRRMFDIVRERDGRDFASQTGRRATGRP
jgi:hypothetical protein